MCVLQRLLKSGVYLKAHQNALSGRAPSEPAI